MAALGVPRVDRFDLGSAPADEIAWPAVPAALTPIWQTKQVTAQRLPGRIENILDAAKVHGWRARENPGRLENRARRQAVG